MIRRLKKLSMKQIDWNKKKRLMNKQIGRHTGKDKQINKQIYK